MRNKKKLLCGLPKTRSKKVDGKKVFASQSKTRFPTHYRGEIGAEFYSPFVFEGGTDALLMGLPKIYPKRFFMVMIIQQKRKKKDMEGLAWYYEF